MKSVIGALATEGQKTYLVQDDVRVLATAQLDSLPCPAVLENRDRIIGNGKTEGEGVFDFRYGPFTGGYPEAGLIHYYTYGEKVLSVEIDLSLKHRGIEEALRGLTAHDAAPVVAGLCGTLTVSHSLAFARAVEALAQWPVDTQTERLRLAALELERIYNHLYVIMRLASAAAQKVLHAHLAALFEEALRITGTLTGTRGMREFVTPFGTPKGGRIAEVIERTARLGREFNVLYRKSLESRNYLDRLHRTAIVPGDAAVAGGLTGPSLRASGVSRDLRAGESLYEQLAPRTRKEGDAFARMEVRAEEILDSCACVERLLAPGKDGRGTAPNAKRATEDETRGDIAASEAVPGARELHGSAAGAAESSTGTVAWYLTMEHGRIDTAYVSAPSVFGFQSYADAIVGNIFTDVPFAIESFGVSFADAGR